MGDATRPCGPPSLHLRPILSSSSNRRTSSPARFRPGPRGRAWSSRFRLGWYWRRTMCRRGSGGPTLTSYSPAASVCSKWNWLTPPAAWSLVATDCFLGCDHRDRCRPPFRRKRSVERLADANILLGEPARGGQEHDLLHDRSITLVNRPVRPAGVGRGRDQDHRSTVAMRLRPRRDPRCRTPMRSPPSSPWGPRACDIARYAPA